MAKWTVVTSGNPHGWLVMGKIVSSTPAYSGERIKWEIEADGAKSLLISVKAGGLSITEHE